MAKRKRDKKREELQKRQEKQKKKVVEQEPTAFSEALDKVQGKMEVVGFATKDKGTVIHAVLGFPGMTSGKPACSIGVVQTNQIYQKPSDITCKKCLRLSVVKDLIKPKVEEVKQEEQKEVVKEETIPETATSAPETTTADDSYMCRDEFLQLLQNKLRHFKTKVFREIEDIITSRVEEILQKRPDFLIISKANGRFGIVHEPSRYVITDNISALQAEVLLNRFLNIQHKWDGKSKPPQEWLTTIAVIFEEFMKESKKVGEEEKPTLKVRRKKSKDKSASLSIRRRKKKPEAVTLRVRRRAHLK